MLRALILLSFFSTPSFGADADDVVRLFPRGVNEISFALHKPMGDSLSKDAPQLIFLKKDPALASMIKAGRTEKAAKDLKENKNYKFPEATDKEIDGIAVQFQSLRLVRDQKKPDELTVYLVGAYNQIRLPEPISLNDLLTGKKNTLTFNYVTSAWAGVADVSISTTMDIQYRDGILFITNGKGGIVVEYATLLKAFYTRAEETQDLPDLIGELQDKSPNLPVFTMPAAK